MINVYFETSSHVEKVATFESEALYLLCLPALEIEAKRQGYIVSESDEVQEAKDTLKDKGYYIDNLWSVSDVQSKFNCNEDEAQTVLDKALQTPNTMEQVWIDIEYFGNEQGLAPLI